MSNEDFRGGQPEGGQQFSFPASDLGDIADQQQSQAGDSAPETGAEQRGDVFDQAGLQLAEHSEQEFNEASRRVPPWLKTAAKATGAALVGGVVIGFASGFAESRGLKLPETAADELWAGAVSMYYFGKKLFGKRFPIGPAGV
jgi:hypothetical protein